MIFTTEQEKFLKILNEPHFLTMRQALVILKAMNPDKTQYHLDHMLSRLHYCRKLLVEGDYIFEAGLAIPGKSHVEPDRAMQFAVDVMLDLSKGKIACCTASSPPCLLKFICDGSDVCYAAVPLPVGAEAATLLMLEQQRMDENWTLIFLAERMAQREKLKTIPIRHYFAILEDGKIRYFRGGESANNRT